MNKDVCKEKVKSFVKKIFSFGLPLPCGIIFTEKYLSNGVKGRGKTKRKI
jgi:hypothetical protein